MQSSARCPFDAPSRNTGFGAASSRANDSADGQVREIANLLNREFTAGAPNRKWLVDITAVATDESCLYLVGWAMDDPMPDELTQAPLEMAILQRQPPAQLLHHSDQGSQYTREEYQALLAKHPMLTSLSGVACCYDNAPMECLWAPLKPNLFTRQHYRTRQEAKNAIFAYIEG